MIKFKKNFFGGYNIKDVDEKVEHQINILNKEKLKLHQQINELLEENIILSKQMTVLKEKYYELDAENQRLTDSNDKYRSILIQQVNKINSEDSYLDHKKNREKISVKYKEEKSN